MTRLIVALGLALVATACTPSRSADTSASNEPPIPRAAASTTPYTRPSRAELASRLTPLQFEVTQNGATEPPFRNAYWDNHEAGIYVDVATGEPLFSSQDKFESGTGWPSFTKPIEDARVVEHKDVTLGMVRTEVLSKSGASHLGHVFDDGPAPTRLRYCINSASLRFVPAARLAAEGYGDYASRFRAGVSAFPPPAATANSCTEPRPGESAGCHSTLQVAVFARLDDDDRVAKLDGVLEVTRGYEGAERAVEVTFDPAKVTYKDVLQAWTKGRETRAKVFAQDDAQKGAAAASAVRVAPAVPFRRE